MGFRRKFKNCFILLIAIVMLLVFFVGCSGEDSKEKSTVKQEVKKEEKRVNDTPTSAVNNFFIDIDKNIDERLDEIIRITMPLSKSLNLTEEENKEFLNLTSREIKKVKCEVISEEIKGDKATVNVKISGPDTKDAYKNAFTNIRKKGSYTVDKKERASTEDVMKIMKEEFQSPKKSEREGRFLLTKVNGEWEVDKSAIIIGHVLTGE